MATKPYTPCDNGSMALLHEDVEALPADMLHHVGQEYESEVAIEIGMLVGTLALGNLV